MSITDYEITYSSKANQTSLHEDVELFVDEQKANGFNNTKSSQHTSVGGDHGRIETPKGDGERGYRLAPAAPWLAGAGRGWPGLAGAGRGWPGLKSVIAVESTREIGDKTEHETRLYISSLDLAAAQLGPIIRSHWAIENSLHWVMDMVFRDDEYRLRTDHAPANFTTIKHMAQNLIRRDPGKDSLRLRRKVAAWDDDFLASLITQ